MLAWTWSALSNSSGLDLFRARGVLFDQDLADQLSDLPVHAGFLRHEHPEHAIFLVDRREQEQPRRLLDVADRLPCQLFAVCQLQAVGRAGALLEHGGGLLRGVRRVRVWCQRLRQCQAQELIEPQPDRRLVLRKTDFRGAVEEIEPQQVTPYDPAPSAMNHAGERRRVLGRRGITGERGRWPADRRGGAVQRGVTRGRFLALVKGRRIEHRFSAHRSSKPASG
jgi:hypothetical protein